MDVVLKVQSNTTTSTSTQSFNPCFYGCCTERNISPDFISWINCFNPCFYGCCTESLERCKTRVGEEDVSILVFMDVVLKVEVRPLTYGKAKGFNPCFYGCCTERSKYLSSTPKRMNVSILVFMDVVLKALEII